MKYRAADSLKILKTHILRPFITIRIYTSHSKKKINTISRINKNVKTNGNPLIEINYIKKKVFKLYTNELNNNYECIQNDDKYLSNQSLFDDFQMTHKYARD
ncbi:hypothetical protein BpHYR1_018568 [Brachionus plicatilis]|uniref:Uncharacterized protein n=1 Tax=Brachionus plicatilis TaxID=10195 RepID=A0A3M7QV62_BRAPC|nr:hypothetical protein BpHYR1_018568 [Brachionus plicatilis]